jgi:deoxyribodipyrimidine photo-lyase
MANPSRILLWFRRDLRLSDNPALAHAIAQNAEIIPVFIFDPYLLHHPETGVGRVQFLLGCLESLQKNLEHLGSTLIRRQGPQQQVLVELAQFFQVDAVYWNDDSERTWRSQTDLQAIEALQSIGLPARVFRAEALLPAGGKDTYALKTFTPQWYQFMNQPLHRRPEVMPPVPADPVPSPLRTLADLGLPPTDQQVPTAGEREAHCLLHDFLGTKAPRYLKSLSIATEASQSTSRLGPHLKFGTISARTVFHAVQQRHRVASSWEQRNLDGFVSRLFWRDHFSQKLRNLPHCETASYLEAFERVPWSQNTEHYQAWCEGQTGYPLVDAAMRCLNQTGWLWGARHFMQKLFDGDVAIDHWQWQSHAGVSNRGRAWFRVYHPTAGIDKIDPKGSFIRQWVPELADLPFKELARPNYHALGYYPPVIDHTQARLDALAILEPIKRDLQP